MGVDHAPVTRGGEAWPRDKATSVADVGQPDNLSMREAPDAIAALTGERIRRMPFSGAGYLLS